MAGCVQSFSIVFVTSQGPVSLCAHTCGVASRCLQKGAFWSNVYMYIRGVFKYVVYVHTQCMHVCGVCKCLQTKKVSVKAKRRLLKQGAKHNLVCNNCPIHPEQDYFPDFFTLADLQRLTLPVFARPSQGLVWTAGCISAAPTYCQLSPKVKRFFDTHCQNRQNRHMQCNWTVHLFI